MAKLIDLQPTKTYATRENAIKAVEKAYGAADELRYLLMQDIDDRWFPVFIGEKAIQQGVHFNFAVVN